MLILNLGCGTRTSAHPDVVNVDWSLNIRIKKSRLLRLAAAPLLDARRRARLEQMVGNLLPHDLSKGIPFPADSVDTVYQSHVLEHLDRPVARDFLTEVLRVLKPGGICRIVVPDLEFACRSYVQHIDRCEHEPDETASHERYVEEILEQSVRREAAATRQRRGVARFLEHRILGDARRRGETHQWMYDRISLPYLMRQAGFSEVQAQAWDSSWIADWNQIGLDRDTDGAEYKPHSLYVEGRK